MIVTICLKRRTNKNEVQIKSRFGTSWKGLLIKHIKQKLVKSKLYKHKQKL